MPDNNGEIIIYQSEDGVAKIEVRVQDETVWLSQQQMAELFNTSRTNVVDHIKNIYEEGELSREATCRKSRQVVTTASAVRSFRTVGNGEIPIVYYGTISILLNISKI